MSRHLILLVLTALLLGLVLPRYAAAELIDLGATETVEVNFLDDPRTLVRIPPGAFGEYPTGTFASIVLDAPLCNGPNCIGGRGMLVTFDMGFSGFLEKPVIMQVGYDEESVGVFGVGEEDLVLAAFNGRQWAPMEDQVIDTEQDVVWAAETHSIRQFIAIFAANPAPVEPATWGGIKAAFGRDATPLLLSP